MSGFSTPIGTWLADTMSAAGFAPVSTGVGLLFITAVQFVDIPVMAAYLVLIALIFVVINLIVDLLYFVVDPRLRMQRTGRGQ